MAMSSRNSKPLRAVLHDYLLPPQWGWGWWSRLWVVKVRLKWVKNRGFDHIIDRDTDIKDAIAAAPSGSLPARSLAAPFQKTLGVTVPVRFLRRYLPSSTRRPTLVSLPFPHSPSPPPPSSSTAVSVLPSTRPLPTTPPTARTPPHDGPLSRSPPRGHQPSPIRPRPPSGLPIRTFSRPSGYLPSVPPPQGRRTPALTRQLARPPCSLRSPAPSPHALDQPSYQDLRKPSSSSTAPLAFPMRFPRGYGSMKKVKAWMENFHLLPYVSPYVDASGIDPDSDLMEKHVVGDLHELLSLTIHKKTKRNYLRCLREELGLPHKFTRVFTRFPGIFYLSLKCKNTTVVLREAYHSE